jgi:hypothetical protein
VIDVFEDDLFCFGMLQLVFLDDVVLYDGLHGVEVLGALLLDEQDRSEGSLPEHNFGDEIVDGHLIFVVFGEQGFGGFANCFLLVFFIIDVLLIGLIVVHYVFAFELFYPELFLVFFGHHVEHQVEFFPVVDGQVTACHFGVRFEDVVDNAIAHVCRGVPVVILGGDVQDELGSNFAQTDGLDECNVDSPFDFGAFEVVDSEAGDEEPAFLLLLVVIELGDDVAEVDGFWVRAGVPSGLSSLRMDLSELHLRWSYLSAMV